MKKAEKIFGNFMAVLFVVLIAFSILHGIFCLFFRDGRGASMYGGRGDTMMSDSY